MKQSYSAKAKACFNGSNQIKQINLGSKLEDIIANIFTFRRNNNINYLQKEREKLGNLVNLIIYDVQTTGVPEMLDDYDENGIFLGTQHISYPAIIQFSFFHPKTGRHLAKYVKPHKPISFESALLTGIYNSFSIKFELPLYPEKCDPKSLEDVVMIEYINQTLLDRDEVRENASVLRYEEPGRTEEEIGEMAIQKFLEEIGNDISDVIALDDAKMFHELVDEILEFLSRGEGEITILMAHNGSNWAEPILRAEMERVCYSDNIKNYLFVDSKQLYSEIITDLIENEKMIQEENANGANIKSNVNVDENVIKVVASKLGESREESFNTMLDVLNLYSNIEFISEQIYGRSDWNFIISKIVEHLYKCKTR